MSDQDLRYYVFHVEDYTYTTHARDQAEAMVNFEDAIKRGETPKPEDFDTLGYEFIRIVDTQELSVTRIGDIDSDGNEVEFGRPQWEVRTNEGDWVVGIVSGDTEADALAEAATEIDIL